MDRNQSAADPYQDGIDACADGLPQERNPHPDGTSERVQWFQVEHTTPDMFGHAEPLTVCANGADVTRFLRDEDRDGIFAAFSDTWYAASIDPDDEDEEEDDPDNWMEGRGGVMVRVMRRTA